MCSSYFMFELLVSQSWWVHKVDGCTKLMGAQSWWVHKVDGCTKLLSYAHYFDNSRIWQCLIILLILKRVETWQSQCLKKCIPQSKAYSLLTQKVVLSKLLWLFWAHKLHKLEKMLSMWLEFLKLQEWGKVINASSCRITLESLRTILKIGHSAL